MKFAGYILSLAFVVAFGLAPAVAAHKFHTSFTEAEYNDAERSLQITLRTFPDDLENILSRRAGKAVRLDQKKAVEPLLTAYLQETFQLKNARGETVKLSWVGMDAGVDSAWLYFEARLPAGSESFGLSNRLLFDLFDDQINLVNIKANGNRIALRFERGKADFQTVSLK